MTITMNLEIEVGVSFEEIASVLSVMGAEHAIESGYLTGNFKYSGVYFVFRCFSTPEDVAAEDAEATPLQPRRFRRSVPVTQR